MTGDLRDAFATVGAAQAAFAGMVQAAHRAGRSAREIAVDAGCDRDRIVQAITGGRDLPMVVYLRAVRATAEDWAELESLLGSALVTHDRTQAWHLRRGGHRVILCDFSRHLHGGAAWIRIGAVDAKYRDLDDPSPPDNESAPDLALPLISGGLVERPLRRTPDGGMRLDVPAVAAMVLAYQPDERSDDDRPDF